jgi:transposase
MSNFDMNHQKNFIHRIIKILFKRFMPAFSPDINIIETLWSEMKKYVHKVPCNSINALVKRITDFIESFTPARCSNYVQHFKTVINEIILRDRA